MKAKDIMTPNVISVRDDSSVEDVARLLAQYRVSGLPVVDQSGALVGMVTEYDLIAKEVLTMQERRLVADIMSRGVISVSPETDVEEVVHLLTNKRIRRVPVMQGDRLVGIVSRSDLVKQIAMRWVCDTCGEVVHGANAPASCSRCNAPQSAFTHGVMPPGM